MNPAIGQDIRSLCAKCGESWHVVVAKLREEIAKVECKECHAVHGYRDPAGPKRKTARKGAERKRTSRKPAATRIEADMERPIKDYSIKGSFEPGDRIRHASFGEGVVQCSPGPGKVEIIFGDDRKLLAQAKPPSRTRPQ